MRRVIMLALLAIALPTAALADSVDFSTGTFVSGTFTGTFSTSVSTTIVGSLYTTSLSTGNLTKLTSCPAPGMGTCYSFTGGSVTVKSTTGVTLFTDSLTGGIANNNHGSIGILASLMPNGTVVSGTGTVSLTLKKGVVGSGSIDVSFITTPEAGTLGLLGTGLVGLAGIVRRKLRA